MVANSDGGLGIALSFQRRLTAFTEEYLTSERGRVPFGGRDRELDQLDRWLFAKERPSRLLLTAPAGRGKSALIAQWLDRLQEKARKGKNSWQTAFMPVSVRMGTNRPEDFYQGLALRLAEISGLALDATKQPDVEYFKTSVRQQFEHIAKKKRLKVLVVFDGIDEALDGTFDSGVIPSQLPPTLRVLLSARWLPGDRGSKGWLKRLGWDRDVPVEAVELEKLDAERIADVLIRLGAPSDITTSQPELVGRLASLTEGEPLLVRFYCADLWDGSSEGARISAADLETLTPGFASYFARWLEHQEQRWKQERTAADGDKVDRMLLILAHALGRLTEADLAALINEVHGDTTLSFADRLLRPLRRFVMGDGKRDAGFVLSHPKIGDYLRAERFHAAEAPVQRVFADWGRKHVAALNVGEIKSEDASHYLLLYLPKHLEAVGAPASDFMALVANGWRLAWEAYEGGPRGFGGHVGQAWAAARRDKSPDNLSALWRCALAWSSISSFGANIPGPLLIELVKDGTLSPKQAQHYAELSGPTSESIETLAHIAVGLASNPKLAREMVDATIGLLSRQRDREQRGDLIATALGILDPTGDGSGAESYLDPMRRKDLVAEALAAARSVDFAENRYLYLKAVLRHADPAQRSGIAAEAIAAAKVSDDDDPWYHFEAVATLARHLDPAQRSAVVSEALQAAQALDDDGTRALALGELAPQLEPNRRVGVLAEAVAAANAIEDVKSHALVLARLAPHLDIAQRKSVVTQALALARSIRDDAGRASSLAALAPHLEQALRRAVFAEALAAARAITDERRCSELLQSLATQADSADRPAVVAEALAAARASNRNLAYPIASLATFLDDAQRAEALEIAIALRHGWLGIQDQYQALRALAPHLDPAQRVRALIASKAIGDEEQQCRALEAVSRHLDPAQKQEVLADALAAARAIGNAGKRSLALSALAPQLDTARREGAINDAYAAAWAADGSSPLRHEAFAAAAPLLDAARRAKALDAVLAAINGSGIGGSLSKLAPLLDVHQLADALAAAKAVGDEGRRSEAIKAIAPYLSTTQRAEALAAAREIRSDWNRSAILATLPDELDAAQREEAIAVARAMPSSDALAELARRVEPGERPAVLAEALAVARTRDIPAFRFTCLRRLVPHLEPAQRPLVIAEALAAARALDSDASRASSLAEISPYLDPIQRQTVLDEALSAIKAISDENPYQYALSRLAHHVDSAHRAEVLAAVERVRNTWDRFWIVATLVENASDAECKELMPDVLHAVSALPRSKALEAVVKLAGPTAQLGGSTAAAELRRAISDVCNWYP